MFCCVDEFESADQAMVVSLPQRGTHARSSTHVHTHTHTRARATHTRTCIRSYALALHTHAHALRHARTRTQYLTRAAPNPNNVSRITLNYEKFLLGPDGKVEGRVRGREGGMEGERE